MIKLHGSIYYASIPVTKTGVSKSFVTSEEMYPIIEKYMKLHSEGMKKFFLQYRNEKYTHQNEGKGKIGSIPQDIVKFIRGNTTLEVKKKASLKIFFLIIKGMGILFGGLIKHVLEYKKRIFYS